jgi:cytochrome c
LLAISCPRRSHHWREGAASSDPHNRRRSSRAGKRYGDDHGLIDGTGLPPGEGTPAAGKIVWETYCGQCHGATGTEGPIMPPIGPTQVFPKSAGKFWPYATTLFDFIRRAMPFRTPKLLSDDEVYAVTAFILQRNRVIPEDAVMNAATLPRVLMPNRENFIDLWAKQRERPY